MRTNLLGSILTSALVITGAAVANAAPAGATATDSGVHCATGQPPNQTQTVFLNRDNYFSNSAFFPDGIWKGDTVKVFADGLVNDGGWPSSSNWTPAGKNEPADSDYPRPGVNKYSLIGKLRDDFAYNFIGAQSPCTTSTIDAKQLP
jgi:hypothetical protein